MGGGKLAGERHWKNRACARRNRSGTVPKAWRRAHFALNALALGLDEHRKPIENAIASPTSGLVPSIVDSTMPWESTVDRVALVAVEPSSMEFFRYANHVIPFPPGLQGSRSRASHHCILPWTDINSAFSIRNPFPFSSLNRLRSTQSSSC